MADEKEQHLCTVRMSAEENARTVEVAAHHGINVSSLIRLLVKREARDIGIEPATTNAKRTTK